jgi:hypothetical protein
MMQRAMREKSRAKTAPCSRQRKKSAQTKKKHRAMQPAKEKDELKTCKLGSGGPNQSNTKTYHIYFTS